MERISFIRRVSAVALGCSLIIPAAMAQATLNLNVTPKTESLNVSDIQATTQEEGNASAEDAENAKKSLDSFGKKLNFLHTTTELPYATADGAQIEWSCNKEAEGYVNISASGGKQVLNVEKQPQDDRLTVATLTAKVTFANGTSTLLPYKVTLAPEDTEYGYLYCFMNPTYEITNYALGSKADKGRKFDVLLNGKEVFNTAELAGIEHGTRDAYMGKGRAEDEYFMTTTDMKQAVSGVWNNYGMNLLRSQDMVHWESSTFDFRKGKSIFSDPDATTDAYKTDAEYRKIYRVWAPQFIWDKDAYDGEGAWLVYYSLLSTNSGDTYDKIYYSYADRDFKTLTQPRLFFDPGCAVIDGDIVLNPYDGLYHMYFKREGASGSARGIYEATSERLVGSTWTEVMHVTNEGSALVEGSSTVRRINEDAYNLYYMRYSDGYEYKYCETDHLCLNPTSSNALQGTGNFQHGSILTITETEYKMLQAWSDATLMLEEVKTLKKNNGTTIFDASIEQTENALAIIGVDELAEALPKAIAAMKEAKAEMIAGMLKPGEATELTSLLVNPDFTNGSDGWSGTSFTAASQGVAEHWNKNSYNTYQVLENMPAGEYRLECQGFYRYGSIQAAYTAHTNDTEKLCALLYINDEASAFMSIYDESVPYTYSPYTYPDNVTQSNNAFRKGYYADNSVTYTLEEQGDLYIGICKYEGADADWNCFDNFRLYCTLPETDGIGAIETNPNVAVDVYSAGGILIRKGVSPTKAQTGLPAGIYIIGGKKVAVK